MKSEEYRSISKHLSDILHFTVPDQVDEAQNVGNEIKITQNSVFFANIRIIHFSLHLLYEELKLNVLRKKDLKMLSDFLSKVSYDLGLHCYQMYYWKDYPNHCDISKYSNRVQLNQANLKNVTHWPCIDNDRPISIFQFLHDLLCDQTTYAYPYVRNINPRTKDVIQVGISCAIS